MVVHGAFCTPLLMVMSVFAVQAWHLVLDAIPHTTIYSSSLIGHVEPLTCLCLLTGDMSGPSSMSQPPNEADMPPAASSAAAGLPSAARETSRFKAGARVFFDSNGVPVKGTVAKPHSTGERVDVPTVLRPASALHVLRYMNNTHILGG